MSVNKLQRAFEEKAFGKPTIVPHFFEFAQKSDALTRGYGINVYDSQTFVRIKTQGRKDNTVREATQADKELFHEHYKKFKEEAVSSYMPMEALAGFSVANQFTLRDLGVTSVTELAEYKEPLPLASLKLMQHCAEFLVGAMSEYEPPSFKDEEMKHEEAPEHGTIQAGRQVLQARQNGQLHDSPAGNNGEGVQRLGVSFDEHGNITEINGQPVQAGWQEEGRQEEGQQEERRPKAVNFF